MSAPRILLIDTSTSRCTLGLSGDRLLKRESLSERQSAQKILPLIQQLCEEAEIGLAQLDAVAVMAGPGSFTGLRIGVGVAQAIAYANSLPAIAVSTLAVLAESAAQENSAASAFWVAMPAREGEYYFGAYERRAGGGVSLQLAEQVCNPADMIFPAPGENLLLVGQSWQDEALGSASDAQASAAQIDCEASLPALAALANVKLELKDYAQPADLKPNYVKEQLDY